MSKFPKAKQQVNDLAVIKFVRYIVSVTVLKCVNGQQTKNSQRLPLKRRHDTKFEQNK